MHQTSLGGRCFAAAAMKAAAPDETLRYHVQRVLKDKQITLSYPDIRMIQESKCRAHEFPDTHLLK